MNMLKETSKIYLIIIITKENNKLMKMKNNNMSNKNKRNNKIYLIITKWKKCQIPNKNLKEVFMQKSLNLEDGNGHSL